jgi:hypothetical protein
MSTRLAQLCDATGFMSDEEVGSHDDRAALYAGKLAKATLVHGHTNSADI